MSRPPPHLQSPTPHPIAHLRVSGPRSDSDQCINADSLIQSSHNQTTNHRNNNKSNNDKSNNDKYHLRLTKYDRDCQPQFRSWALRWRNWRNCRRVHRSCRDPRAIHLPEKNHGVVRKGQACFRQPACLVAYIRTITNAVYVPVELHTACIGAVLRGAECA